MIFTKRFIFIIGLGIIPIGFAYPLGLSLHIFIGYNIAAIIALLYDYKISHLDKNIHIKRIGDEKISINEIENIGFEVYNGNNIPIRIEVRDEVPDFHFEILDKTICGKLDKNTKEKLYYRLIPRKRGAYDFDKVHMRILSTLKLIYIKKIIDLPITFKVYPNLKNLNRYRLLVAKNNLSQMGRKRIKVIGSKTSFSNLREYVYGDEFRKINWNATARENKLIVNEYEPEKNQRVHILIDRGRNMSGEIMGHKKLDIAIDSALLLCDIVNQKGDLCSLIAFNREIDTYIKANKGSSHRSKIVDELYSLEGSPHISHYKKAFLHLKSKEKHRSIVFLFLDFNLEKEGEDLLKNLHILSKNNIVVVVVMDDKKNNNIIKRKIKNIDYIYENAVAMENIKVKEKAMSILKSKRILVIEATKESIALEVVNKYLQIKSEMNF